MAGALGLVGGALGLNQAGKSLGMTGESRIDTSKFQDPGLARLNEIATSPEAKQALGTGGSGMATKQFMENPLMSQIYGGGQLGQQMQRLQGMQGQEFQLKPEDQTMYGQMSGDIARQFGQQGQSAAANLASRGLGAGASGAAGATFSGLQGSQNEMLAKAQQDIMRQRFQQNMQAIGQQQQLLGQLQQGAQQGIEQQFGRNLAGLQGQAGMAGEASAAQQRANAANLQGQMAQEQTRTPTLGEMIGQGLGSSAYNLAASPGKAVSSFAGSLGKGGGGGGASAPRAG